MENALKLKIERRIFYNQIQDFNIFYIFINDECMLYFLKYCVNGNKKIFLFSKFLYSNKNRQFIMRLNNSSNYQSQHSKFQIQSNLSQFQSILSNQHSKQFHLIDNPDLIFQLAQYKFKDDHGQNSEIFRQKNQSSSKKFYRHKSQDQNQNFQFFNQIQQSSNTKNINVPFKKIKHSINSFQQQTNPVKQLKFQCQIQKINLSKEKSKTKKQSKQKNEFKGQSKFNFKQKQNIQSRILSAPRPLTSNIFSLKNGNSWNKNTGKDSQTKNGWKKAVQRKKYCELKQKLQVLIKSVQKAESLNFSQIFQYQQAILKDFLSSLVTQLKKQCLQKGQLVELIWNTFFILINKIMCILTKNKKKNQKSELQTQITLHEQYQEMHQKQLHKIKQLGKKYNESKNVIDRLIYELRYKRKQVKKLVKNLAICNEKLNQYKVQHIELQNQHIDVLMDLKQINKEEAIKILSRKIEVNKEKYQKIKVGQNKDKLKQNIQKQIQDQKLSPLEQQNFKKQLFDKINGSLTNSKVKKSNKDGNKQGSKQQSCFIEEFIQKFSNKYIQPANNSDDVEIYKAMRRPQRISTATNTEFDFKFKPQTSYFVTQTSFSDKLEFSLINNRSTQTPGAQKIKKTENVEVQADGDQMRLVHLKSRMMNYKTLDQSFYFDIQKRDQRIKLLQPRKSQYSFKRSQQKNLNNNSISQIQSQSEEKDESISSKRRISKNFNSSVKRQKKASIFNSALPNFSATMKSSNFKNTQNGKQKNNRNSTAGFSGSKLHKKRVSQIGQNMNFLANDKNRQDQKIKQKKKNKTAYLSPQNSQSGFYNRSNNNRPSICISGVDSITDNISMNEQKQKYIENYIMNKQQQQFEVLDQNSIFETFKQILLEKNSFIKSSFYKKSKNQHHKIEQQDQNSQGQSDYEVLNPKSSNLSSLQRLKQIQNEHKQSAQRTNKRIKSMKPNSVTKLKQKNYRKQRQSLQQVCFLNKLIEFTVKKSLIKRKMDQNNFNACKQKSQFNSITQKIDPFMLDVECLINQNFNKKRNKSQINIKSANKFIMMTYSRSIDKISRNNAILQNLIKPLFQSFEVIYGALKPQQIYKKMVSFISDIIAVKQNQNFKQFIFFLGLDKEKSNSVYLTTFDVCLFLKLLQKLNLSGKISYQIENIFTSKNKVNSQLLSILKSQNLSPQVILIVLTKIQDILEKLQDFVRQSESSEEESKINLFKVSRMIVEQIIKIRIKSLKKLQVFMNEQKPFGQMNVKQIIKSKHQKISIESVLRIINICRISTFKKLYIAKYVEQLCLKQQNKQMQKKITKSELGLLLVRIGLIDFDQLQNRMKFLQQRKSVEILANLQLSPLSENQTDYLSLSRNLQVLNKVQIQTNDLMESILGDLKTIYEIGLIKSLEIRNELPVF